MSGANTLSSTIGQLAARLGVAVGALALRLFGGVIDALVPRVGVVVDYHLAFVMLALLMLLPAAGGNLATAPERGR